MPAYCTTGNPPPKERPKDQDRETIESIYPHVAPIWPGYVAQREQDIPEVASGGSYL